MNVLRIQRFCTSDGPGIRTTVFLKGCPLHCRWCHNPESQKSAPQIFFAAEQCIDCRLCQRVCPQNAHLFSDTHSFERNLCAGCGACSKYCPTQSLEQVGGILSSEEILKIVEKDRAFYGTQGGLTLSGGEPMMQGKQTIALLSKAKEQGFHTAIESCGVFDRHLVPPLSTVCDLALFDFKDSDPIRFKEHTGGSLDTVLENLYALDRFGVKTILRCILLVEINDNAAHAANIAKVYHTLSNCIGVQIIAHHSAGRGKYAQLGMPYTDLDSYTPTEEQIESFIRRLRILDVPILND